MTAGTAKLLVVDDEPEMRSILIEYFGRYGFEVKDAQDAEEARHVMRSFQPHLALVDVNMPGENGLSLVRWMREVHPTTATVLLTANSETIDRVVGLEIGADDYVSKPCELRELLARVRAVLRRSQPVTVEPLAAGEPAEPAGPVAPAETPVTPRMKIGERTLDLNERKLYEADGQELELTASEFDLLALFARHPNRPLTRDQIMAQAHKKGWDVFDRSIDLRIMRLRRKIERNPDKPEIIKTVRNVGYVFAMPLA